MTQRQNLSKNPLDPRPGDFVFIRRSETHPHPVYLADARDRELHAEPVRVRWRGYYHDLRQSGAVVIVPSDEVEKAAAALEEQLLRASPENLAELCGARLETAEATAQQLDQHGAALAAATCRAAAAAEVASWQSRWEALRAQNDNPAPSESASEEAGS